MDNNQEFKDVLTKIRTTFGLREGTLAMFLITVILLRVTGFIAFFKQVDWVIFAIAAWLVSTFIFRFLVGRRTTASGLINLYLIYDILVELPILSFIVYSAGGVEWIACIFFLFPVVYTSTVFPRKIALLGYTAASIYYLLLVLLPYFNIIPFKPYLGTNLHHDPNYVITNIILTVSTFYLVGLAANLLTELVKKRTTELEGVKKELENEKTVLEIKVKARTKALEEFATGLEEKVKERTKELEEKIEESEKFNKLAVGRELKMIELKNQIEELKKRLKQ